MTDGPLIVQSDKTLLLEVDHERAVRMASRIPDGVLKALAAMGHEIVMRGDYSSTRMGAGQAVMRNYTTGINAGASDPRKDGSAVSELLRVPARK